MYYFFSVGKNHWEVRRCLRLARNLLQIWRLKFVPLYAIRFTKNFANLYHNEILLKIPYWSLTHFIFKCFVCFDVHIWKNIFYFHCVDILWVEKKFSRHFLTLPIQIIANKNFWWKLKDFCMILQVVVW